MARSPLMRRLLTLARDIRVARDLDIDVAEVHHRRELQRLERREFLVRSATTLGAGLAGLTLPRRAFAAGGVKPRIAIVGGGMAGLTSALDLDDHGISATIYEASSRIGGRMFSRTDDYFGGQVIEWGGEFIDSSHHTMRSLAKRFGLKLVDVNKAQGKKAEDVHHLLGGYYTEEEAVDDFLAMFDAVETDLQGADYPTTFDSSTKVGSALDLLSVRQYIEARVPGGLSSKFGRLLDIAYNGEYSAETTDQSALNLLYLLGYQPKKNAFEVFGESDERFRIIGGNDRLPKKIAKHLGEKSIALEHQLVALKRNGDGSVTLTFDTPSGTIEKIADAVVLTLPFAVLRNLDLSGMNFQPLKLQAISELGRGLGGKLQVQFSQRLWTEEGPWGKSSTGATYSDLGYQSTWESTRGQKGKEGILVIFTGGTVTNALATHVPFADATTPEVVTDVNTHLSRLTQVFPGLDLLHNGKAASSLPHFAPNFGLSYAYYRVGQYTQFGGIEGQPEGNVFFAGEHTSRSFQGFMEGAAATGKRAGKQLRQFLKS